MPNSYVGHSSAAKPGWKAGAYYSSLTLREEAAGSILGGPCTVAFIVLFGDIAKYHSYFFRNGVSCGKLECVLLNRELLLSATASCAYEEILARSY